MAPGPERPDAALGDQKIARAMELEDSGARVARFSGRAMRGS